MKSFCFIVDSWLKLIVRRLGLFSLCLCVSAIQIFSQDWKSVADGVEYAEVRREFSGKAVDINLLRLNLKKVRLDVHHAMDMAIGTEKTSSIATRHKAFAAINAGFFRLDNSLWAGDAAGVLQIDEWLYSESSNDRIALFIDNNLNGRTYADFEKLTTIEWISVNKKKFEVGRNRQRTENDLVIYTQRFSRTTLTDLNGIEFVVRNRNVAKISDGIGSSEIPQDGYVLSASGTKRNELLKLVKVGTKIVGTSKAGSYAYSQAEDIVGGVPQLIKNGKIDITWEQEKASRSFVETRHPRTAVAKLKDGKFLMLTADGRSEQSAGLDLYDLAKYMLELGALDAMNLDGGGSTTMFLDGKVVNRPSDKDGERKVGDAIVVTLRKKKS